MRLTLLGSLEVDEPRTVVWQRLMDPQFVAAASPGVEKVEQVDERHFKVYSAFGLGALKLHFTLDVELMDVRAPSHVTMRAHGKAPGSAVDVTSAIDLVEPDAGRTSLHWRSEFEVSGILAGIGGHLLEGTARKLTEQFWQDFAARCAQPA